MDVAREPLDLALLFVTSLGLGMFMGIERQRDVSHRAGVRTFALTALLGTTAALVAEASSLVWVVALGLILTGAAILADYRRTPFSDEHPGTTTVIALLLCYLLGAMVWYGYPSVAISLAIVTTVLLHFKPTLHGISGRLSEQDLSLVLQLAVLSFVVLPLLPNRGYGPFDALNPYQIWLMVVLVSGVSLVGYLALKFGDPSRSIWLMGLAGGLVSSTATTLAFSRHAARDAESTNGCAKIIALANLVMLLRIMLIVTVVAPGVSLRIGAWLLLALVVSAAAIARIKLTGYQWNARAETESAYANPTSLTPAVGFGAMYAAVLLLLAWIARSDHAQMVWGHYVISVASGLADVDAITLSNLRLMATGELETNRALASILAALLANALFKLAIARVIGGATLARRCAPSLLATAGALALGVWLM
jgi:uncharacterized membrane protein (DUF4010 family)